MAKETSISRFSKKTHRKSFPFPAFVGRRRRPDLPQLAPHHDLLQHDQDYREHLHRGRAGT